MDEGSFFLYLLVKEKQPTGGMDYSSLISYFQNYASTYQVPWPSRDLNSSGARNSFLSASALPGWLIAGAKLVFGPCAAKNCSQSSVDSERTIDAQPPQGGGEQIRNFVILCGLRSSKLEDPVMNLTINHLQRSSCNTEIPFSHWPPLCTVSSFWDLPQPILDVTFLRGVF